ncbi:hypothetical protein GCM10010214_20200 [Streptomyces abikoensis]|nr:hypothetical protein GCM10010214_20200 [Streptomyces abikoensis]
MGGPALGTGGHRARVDLDQAERLQLRRDGTGGRPGHPELGGEDGARGGATGVYELKGGAEGAPSPLQTCCPSLRHASILTLCRR